MEEDLMTYTPQSASRTGGYMPKSAVKAEPKKEGLLSQFGKAVVKPAIDYAKYVGEAGVQGARAVADPLMRKKVLSGYGIGEGLTDEERQEFLKKKETFLMKPEELGKDAGDIALTGAKRTAGAMAYAVPGAGVGGTVGKAALTGAAAGGLTGFSQSEKGKEIAGTAGGAVVGGLAGGALAVAGKGVGALWKAVSKRAADLTGKATIKIGAMTPDKQSMARNLYNSSFEVPRKIAARMDMDGMADDMIRYDLSGNLDDLATTSSKVTGNTGAVTRAMRDALGVTKEPIDITDAITAAKVAQADALNVDDKVVKKTLQKVTNIVSKRQEGAVPGKTSAIDVWDAVVALEKEGYGLHSKSTDLTPRIDLEQQGDMFLRAADALKNQIDDAQVAGGALESIKHKYVAEIAKISPELADDFMNVRTVSELRSLAKPFVDLSNAVKLTKTAGNTAWQKLLSGERGLRGVNIVKPGTWIEPFVNRPGVKTGAAIKTARGVTAPKVNVPNIPKTPPIIGEFAKKAAPIGAVGMTK